MRSINIGLAFCIFVGVSFSTSSLAEISPRGKIVQTGGHYVPQCRKVTLKENETGIYRSFRIRPVDGKDDVQAVALMALASNKDVVISWTPAAKTGCGTEPAIEWIEVWSE